MSVKEEEPDDFDFVGEGDVHLLPHEQHLLLETMDDDVLFIAARGLGIERLFLNHLIMYSEQKMLFLILNTSQHDEAYFLMKLKEYNVPCQPKLINADVNTKDREAIYLEGGVQFITSRILLVDLLTSRIPVNHVAGILVYRAHQVLNTFQDSFILRLYREKKRDGFVKAFTDSAKSCSALGQLQRIIDRLYVKKVCILPRFHELVRDSLDSQTITEWTVHLPQTSRRVHTTLHDIIRLCLRELKQISLSKMISEEDEVSDGIFAYTVTALERQLIEKRSFITDKQRRLISDLEILRELLRLAEDMDPATLLSRLNSFRNDKEMFERSSGWIVSPTAARLVSDVETLCSGNTFAAPPKWKILGDVLEEIKEICINDKAVGPNGPSVLVFVSDEHVCRQISDVIKNGPEFVEWMSKRCIVAASKEPAKCPLWDPEAVSIFLRSNVNSEARGELKSDLQKNQKEVARVARKRRKFAEDLMQNEASSMKQTKISQFGILQYKKKETQDDMVEPKEEPPDEEPEDTPQCSEVRTIRDIPKVPLVVSPVGETYNALRYLDSNKPNVIVLFNSDVATLRMIEIYGACNPGIDLFVHQLMYSESTEEQRYLTVINNETKAFEGIVREKANLLIPRVWDVAREEPPTLSSSTRDGGGQIAEPPAKPTIIVDMREFNSELPTVLYKKGFEVTAATLEVGDYVLSPGIVVERKALDDLCQSLQSGRVLKQSEQMLRHYANSVLLIESNRKFEAKIVNGGPFQGELTRHCREIRSLFCQLIRTQPTLKIIWSLSPANSAEYFAELKIGKENPDVEKAVSLKGDELQTKEDDETGRKRKANPVILRHLSQHLPGMLRGDVERMMVSGKVPTLKDLFTSSAADLAPVLGQQSDAIALLANFNFNQQDTIA